MWKSDDSGCVGKFAGGGLGAGSGILQAGQRALAGMRATTGSGDPERGDDFGRGAVAFSVASETMASADPGDGWVGAAALSYAGANRRQVRSAASIAVLDVVT